MDHKAHILGFLTSQNVIFIRWKYYHQPAVLLRGRKAWSLGLPYIGTVPFKTR